MRYKNSVCFKCVKRRIGCHAACPDYSAEVAEAEREVKTAQMQNAATQLLAKRTIAVEEKYSKSSGKRIKMLDWR